MSRSYGTGLLVERPEVGSASSVYRYTLVYLRTLEVMPTTGTVAATSYLATVDGEPTIATSADRHGIDLSDILHAFDHPMWIDDLDDGLLMVIGPDATGRLLEIGIVEGLDGPVVIHATHARAKYRR
jgi:hypothetical protein